jgi:hypothetical protein
MLQKFVNVGYQLWPRIVPWHISSRDTRVRIEDNGSVKVIRSVVRPRLQVWSYAVSASVLLAGTIAGVFVRRRQLSGDAMLWGVLATFVVLNALYVPATRYKAPMLFVMMFYTAVALNSVREESADDRFTT